MRTTLRMIEAFTFVLFPLVARAQEPVVSKDTISVHTVERGNMPVSTPAQGAITSIRPPRARVALSDQGKSCETGQKAAAEPESPESHRVVFGRVIRVEDGKCEVEFSGPFPASVAIGKQIGALVQASELRDVIFFARPADAKANSDGLVFLIESGDQYARRVSVRYGIVSGPMIQILAGLSPGDRVIVTDMSRWIDFPRVRIQ
jgi:hypothetical protein